MVDTRDISRIMATKSSKALGRTDNYVLTHDLADDSKERGGHYGLLPMQVYLSQNCHQRARLLCAEYIRTHQEDFKEVSLNCQTNNL